MFLSKLGYSELVQRLSEKLHFFRVDPLPRKLSSSQVDMAPISKDPSHDNAQDDRLPE